MSVRNLQVLIAWNVFTYIMFHDLHQGVEAGGSLYQELVALKIIIL